QDYVFCTANGSPLDNDNFTNRVWYPLLRHLGLDARRPYQTRHTCATLWLAAGENPEWVARQLGHATPDAVQDLLALHPEPDAYRRLGLQRAGVQRDRP
ncbi:Phage integrase, partial [mine drainage metagenome]